MTLPAGSVVTSPPYPASPAAEPALDQVQGPAFVGVQGPVDVLELTAIGAGGKPVTEKRLLLVGQLVLANRPGFRIVNESMPHDRPKFEQIPILPNVTGWHVVLADESGKAVIDTKAAPSDLRAMVGSPPCISSFLYSLDLPAGSAFKKGSVTVTIEYTLGNASFAPSRKAEVKLLPADELLCPLECPPSEKGCVVNFGNGPGATAFHVHNSNSWERYAYDMGTMVNGSATKSALAAPANGSHAGKNTDFWTFGLPVHAMKAGKIVVAIDSGKDNEGYWFEAPVASFPNMVVIEHTKADGSPDGTYSMYVHLEQGSVTALKRKVGDLLKAGDEVGKLGNCGPSSQPHLHLAYYTWDKRGHARTLPMRFTNLEVTVGGKKEAITEVPIDQLKAVGTAPK
jgi:hypothetical protein